MAVIGLIHPGSGLGDMLFSYIATRVRAADLGVDFGFVGTAVFKGKSFMDLDFGKEVDSEYHVEQPAGKIVIDDEHKLIELNTPYYNPEFNFIEDGTVIDGYGAQDIRYFEHRMDEVRDWLKVKPQLPDFNTCVINFRGGEFSHVPELFLPKDYWDKAIVTMMKRKPRVKFEVHTDDPELAKQFFPDYPIIADIATNWRTIRYAKFAIISNSAFAIIPALLSGGHVIAPRYWARRNIGQWSMPSNYYSQFQYL